MGPLIKTRSFRLFRKIFRYLRIAFFLLVLLVLISLVYLNDIGLPQFLQKWIVAKAGAQGVTLQARHMRLRWYRGLVLENMSLAPPGGENGTSFAAREAVLEVAFPSRSHPQVNGISLSDARLVLPVRANNPQSQVIKDIHATIRFPSRDVWHIENFQSSFRGLSLAVSGQITNATAMKDWSIFSSKTSQVTTARSVPLEELINQIRFAPASELHLTLRGDARTPSTVTGDLEIKSAHVETPWGAADGLRSRARLHAWSQRQSSGVRLSVSRASTPWATAHDLVVVARVEPVGSAEVKTRFVLSASLGASAWILTTDLNLSGSVEGGISNLTSRGNVDLAAGSITSRVASAAGSVVSLEWQERSNHAPVSRTNMLDLLQAYQFSWNFVGTNVAAPQIHFDQLRSRGAWTDQGLQLSVAEANLYGGEAHVKGSIQAGTRLANFSATSTFDLHQLDQLLNPAGKRFMSQFAWDNPPVAQADFRAILPPISLNQMDWSDVPESLELKGRFSTGRSEFRGIPVTQARSSFYYTNRTWFFPDLYAKRPEGELHLEYRNDDRSLEYRFRVFSQIDPNAVRPILGPDEIKSLGQLKFSTPPEIRGLISGRWMRPEMLGFETELIATNFSFRGEPVDRLRCLVQFTNQFFKIRELRADRGDKLVTSPQIDFDAQQTTFFFTNVYSTGDPMSVARAIGRRTAAAIQPFHFALPPAIRLNGRLRLREDAEDEPDMHFTIEGQEFDWKWFRAREMAGSLNWVGKTLALTNVEAKAYQGELAGSVLFDFNALDGADFRFDAAFGNIDLPSLIRSIDPANTNHLEGQLHGQLIITSANTADTKPYQGYGKINLRDGFLWEVPVFGVFSPVLNALIPGVGKSKAREAAGTFVITNNVIFSDDLEIRAAAASLKYRGSVDFDHRVNARVEAEVLKEMGGVGKIFTYMFMPLTKLFEYKVTGTLSDPKAEPLHIPRLLLVPLRPFHSLRQMLPDKPPSPSVPVQLEPVELK